MDEETLPANDELPVHSELESFEQNLLPPEKPQRGFRFFVGIAALIGFSCLIIGGVVVAIGLGKVESEKAPVEAVLDDFMRDMLDEDVDAALALFSPRAQRQFSKSDMESLLEGNNYVLFEGYQSLTIGRINVKAVANTNPDVPQGTVAEVSGTVAYEDGISGQFVATLEKVGGEWFLFFINITVPPDKLES